MSFYAYVKSMYRSPDAPNQLEETMAHPDQSPTSGFPYDEATSFSSGDRFTGGAQSDADSKKEAAQRVASDAQGRAKDVADTAKHEAADVAGSAKSAAANVADTAQHEAGNVAQEAGKQGRRVLDEGVAELRTQAGAGQQKLAEIARSYGGELQSMTNNSEESGPVTDLANSAQRILDDAANWLERTEPSDVLDSVRSYASRNPWQFLAISAGVGFVGARIVRGLKSPTDGQQKGAALQGGTGARPEVTQFASPQNVATSVTSGGGYDADGYPRPAGAPGRLAGEPDLGLAPGVGMPVDPYPHGGGARGF